MKREAVQKDLEDTPPHPDDTSASRSWRGTLSSSFCKGVPPSDSVHPRNSGFLSQGTIGKEPPPSSLEKGASGQVGQGKLGGGQTVQGEIRLEGTKVQIAQRRRRGQGRPKIPLPAHPELNRRIAGRLFSSDRPCTTCCGSPSHRLYGISWLRRAASCKEAERKAVERAEEAGEGPVFLIFFW